MTTWMHGELLGPLTPLVRYELHTYILTTAQQPTALARFAPHCPTVCMCACTDTDTAHCSRRERKKVKFIYYLLP